MSDTPRSTRDLVVRTESWDEAIHFYGAVLGFSVCHDGPGIRGFDTGSLRLFVEKGAHHGPIVEFLVRDVEEAKGRLLSHGCSLLEEDARIPRCYLRDPYGLVFNLGPAG